MRLWESEVQPLDSHVRLPDPELPRCTQERRGREDEAEGEGECDEECECEEEGDAGLDDEEVEQGLVGRRVCELVARSEKSGV